VADERVQIEIAFVGGQTVGVFVTVKVADELTAALSAEQAVYELEGEENTKYVLPLRAIVYVKRSARETRIGFGGAGR
jgi:hypothetical protein